LAAVMACASVVFADTGAPQEDKALRAISSLYKSSGTLQELISLRLNKFAQDFPASENLGVIHFLQGELYLDRALAMRDEEIKLGVKGKNSAIGKRFAEAIAAYEEASKLDFADLGDSAHYRQGEALYNQDKWDEATVAFTKVTGGSNPGYLEPEGMLGIIYSKLALGKNEDAAKVYDELLKKHPNYAEEPGGLLAGGFLSLEKGDYETAGKRFALVNTPEARFYMACLDMFHDKPYLAAAAFEKLRDEFPSSGLDEKSDFLIGDAFFRSHDYDGAQAKFERFVERYPKSTLASSAIFRVSACKFKRGNNAEAAASFRALMEPTVWTWRASLNSSRG